MATHRRGTLAQRLLLAALMAVAASASLPARADVATGAVVTVGGSSHLVAGSDIERAADALIILTPLSGAVTPTNEWGAEAAVVSGRVIALSDRQTTGAAGISIPATGFVLSGHGTAREWLLAHATVGAQVGRSVTTLCTSGFVRLTFDDGPDPIVTPQVLDTLRTRGVTATFFVIGQKAHAFPRLVRREALQGNVVGNHTWDHPYLTALTPSEQVTELKRASRAITSAGVAAPTLWRPPYEDWNTGVRALAQALGMTMQLWTYETDSNDWMGGSPQTIRDRVVANAHDGDIVLMHDRIQNSATALPGILDGLAAAHVCVDPARA